jgi:hypothetical protein
MMLVLISSGQNFTGGFNFRLPPFDSTSQFFLPVFHNEIIDDTSFVKADHLGNFTIHGDPVKFFGVNITAEIIGTDKNKAPGIAGRMRKMGFNIVRFNLIDAAADASLFFGTPNTRVFNATNYDIFEYFISELRRNGIYLHMVLLSYRPFCAADGVIAADSLSYSWLPNKAIPLFDPQLIKLQKEYASQLLTHVNPYTGKALVNDPVLATVEVANENSLFKWWQSEFLKPRKNGGILPYYYSRELDTLWNNFLSQKYGTMQALTDSWSAGRETPPPEILINGNFEAPSISDNWNLIIVGDAQADLSKDNSISHSGNSSAKLITTNYDGVFYHIMLDQMNLTFQKDSVYTLEFWAKANKNTSVHALIKRTVSPWTAYGQNEFFLTTEWKKFNLSAKVSEENISTGDIMFDPAENCTIWFDDISLKDTGPIGIVNGEDFGNYSIVRNDYKERTGYSKKRISDLMEFYTKVQTDYYNGMRDYLRNDLGVKVPIEGTNYLVGPEDLLVQKNMDFTDNHCYWDHPSFPDQYWSPDNWVIRNESIIHNDNANTINYLFSGFQLKNKPFVVGEYFHPNPNIYQTEMIPFITGYSAFHGADAIMFHAYNPYMNWDIDCINDFFMLHNNNALLVNSPSFAYVFRNNLIKEASSQIELNYSVDDLNTILKPAYENFSTSNFYPPKLALTHKIVTASLNESQSTLLSELPAEPTSPYLSSTGELNWDNNGIYTIETDRLINFTGFLYNFPDKALTNATLVSADKFGTVTWLALDDTILTKSRKSLITISARQQNTGMTWDGITTIHNNWGTAPTEIEPMNLILSLSIDADSIRVFPMDTLGAYHASMFVTYNPISAGKFTVNLNQNVYKTCWYGVETLINGSGPVQDKEKISRGNEFLLNYPNPFGDITRIKYRLERNSNIELRVCDLVGKEVFLYKKENETLGEHEIEMNAKSLKSGIYLCTLKTNIAQYYAKMMVVK